MPKRHRDLRNRDLNGTNIKTVKRGTHIDYYYRMPAGYLPKLEPLGTNRKDAIEAAIILNQTLRPAGDIAAKIINRKAAPPPVAAVPLDNMTKLIRKFQTHYLPDKSYAESTLDEKNYKLEAYIKKFGSRSCNSITVTEIAEYLDAHAPSAYIKHRELLVELMGYAVHQGYRQDNPAAVTMKKAAPTRERQKHTLEGYQKTYAAAPDWLKRAMDIALRSIQRRGDLTRLRFDAIDLHAGTIDILQRKTRNYKNPINIRIQMGDELKEAVLACVNSGIPCPYLIHYRPERMKQNIREAKLHPFAVTDEHLSKMFSKWRDIAGAYDHIPKPLRPGFHDLRGLGAYLYEKAGFPSEYIQALAGHASKAMTDHYIAGHETPLPVTVNANLTLNN